MNVLFIYTTYNISLPYKPLRTLAETHLGISYISSYLRSLGHRTELLVLSRVSGRRKNERMIAECVKRFKPGLIAFSPVSSEYDFAAGLAGHIRKRFPGIYLMAGGAHVSLNPEGVLEHYDALCVGEGEKAVAETAAQLEKGLSPSGIPNLWIRKGGETEKNPARPFLRELDELPFPDREMWEKWYDKRSDARGLTVLLGRGCVYECTYCCNHALKKLAAGSYSRVRSVDNIISELREIVKAYPERLEISFQIEDIAAHQSWLIELCGALEQFNKTLGRPLEFSTNYRVSPGIDPEQVFGALKKANFKTICIGIESGNERIRRDVLNRQYSNEDVIRAAECAHRRGLEVLTYSLIGSPTETLREFRETLALNRQCRPEGTFQSIVYPYPGTVLHETCKRLGLLERPLSTALERSAARIALPGFSKRQIQAAHIFFEYNVCRGRMPYFWLAARMLIRLSLSHEAIFISYRALNNALLLIKHTLTGDIFKERYI
jgi:radical SAM superfamily enzyme YgiQ (UPF0313 family)